MSNLDVMTFLSYQPVTLKEDGGLDNLNYGELREEAILERDKKYVEQLGYNPYWAIGGKNIKDILLGSLFCAPNNPFVAWIFLSDEYIRINKVKRELGSAGYGSDFGLDNIDNSCSDISSEFLVKALANYRVMYFLPNLCKGTFVSVTRGFVDGKFDFLPDEIVNVWDSIILDCIDFVNSHLYFDIKAMEEELHVTKSGAQAIAEMKKAKLVFELVVLPVILEFFSPDNRGDNNQVHFNTSWFYKLGRTYDGWVQLYETFADSCNNGTLTEESYANLVRKGYDLIIEDKNMLHALINESRIYPNDECPCGSGKKFKKCHGHINYSPLRW